MADPSAYHIEDSLCLAPNKLQHTAIPGMNHIFRVKNTTMIGTRQHSGGASLQAPHHCGLHMTQAPFCNVNILLEDVKFDTPRHLKFGAGGGYPVAPSFMTTDNSLKGYSQVISPKMTGYSAFPGCRNDVTEYLGGYACDNSVKSRILMIWGPDMGNLTLNGPGYDSILPCEDDIGCANNGNLMFSTPKSKLQDLIYATGYGGWAKNREIYHLHGLSFEGDIYVIYSDPFLAELVGSAPEEEYIDLVMHSGEDHVTCRVSASDDRRFVAHDGVAPGVLDRDCTVKFRQLFSNDRKFLK